MTGLTVAPPTVPATLARSARRLMVLDTRGDPLSILRAVVRQRSARALHQRQLELPVDARRPLSPKGVEDPRHGQEIVLSHVSKRRSCHQRTTSKIPFFPSISSDSIPSLSLTVAAKLVAFGPYFQRTQ